MSKLNGQVAVVTGGNSGIGLATAKLFKAEGAKVVITARSAETFEKAQKEYGQHFDVVQADVSNLESLDKFYAHVKAKYGKIDVLFANAGVAAFSPTENVEEAFFNAQFDTNVKGLYFTVAKASALLSPGARVVLNASTVSYKGFSGSSVYSATKAAVRSFARTWATEWGPRNIRVNAVSPGPIETPIFGKMGMAGDDLKSFETHMAGSLALKRFGQADEIAKVALFLASDDSSFITGSDIVADGGFSQL